jgi:flagellar motility protein MotE (MotC chaperone)
LNDIETRITLLEKTAMTREAVIEREEKLLDRIDALMSRHQAQADKTLEHTLKMFGHDIAEQLTQMRAKINGERDQKLAEAVGAVRAEMVQAEQPKSTESPFRQFLFRNWVWIGTIVVLIILLRPDLAGAAVRLVI